MQKYILISSLSLFSFLTACSEFESKPFVPSDGHINAETQIIGDIPELVTQIPVLPAPTPATELEKYTVVVNEIPVKELLFALARDAQINVDIHPMIEGVVTINAIEQTLLQILDRIAGQVGLRHELSGDILNIRPDDPFLRTYTVDYVNMSREMESSNTISTQIASTSGSKGGGNNSTTDVSSTSNNQFWANLVSNISAILGEKISSGSGGDIAITSTVIPNPESGIIAVLATESQHELIQEFIDTAVGSAKRQVLVQATIVEVTLNDKYQAGIDWSILNNSGAGITITSLALPGTAIVPTLSSSFTITAADPNAFGDQSLTATVRLLDEYGEAKVLSSPQIMTLNNQTALLKIVENFVYFEVDAETTAGALGAAPLTTVDTTVKTVPIGIVMTVTPQIDSEDVITLNVRPTISRVTRIINDPNPNIVAPLVNPVPVIAVKEMESILRLTNGQIGVLGGLMTDETRDNDAGLLGAKKQFFLGNLFKSTSTEYTKTELVIFLRPVLIRTPSLTGDLTDYRQYLNSLGKFTTQGTGSEPN